VSEAGPAPTQATRLPLGAARRGHAGVHVVLHVGGHALEPADGHRLGRFGVALFHPSRRQAGSQGRSQVRPRMPGNTLEAQLIM
jgi:hypothetical protein